MSDQIETYPYRKIAITSFIIGAVFLILGFILLVLLKEDIATKAYFPLAKKLLAGIWFIAIGIKMLWRGYRYEWDFKLEDIYNPSQNVLPGNILGFLGPPNQLARIYKNIINSRSYVVKNNEAKPLNKWQFTFYKLFSRNKIDKNMDGFPYPITNFIRSQALPVNIIGFILLVCLLFFFIMYLEILDIKMIWLNILVLAGLLSFWNPSSLKGIVSNEFDNSLKKKIFLFIAFFLIMLLVIGSSAFQLNALFLFFNLVISSFIIFTAIVSFKLIESVYGTRKIDEIGVSQLNSKTLRLATQPFNIEQQFDNIFKNTFGWCFKEETNRDGGGLSGDERRKGNFDWGHVYETYPTITSTRHNEKDEKRLTKIWLIGTSLMFLGIVLITFGLIYGSGTPIDLTQNTAELIAYSKSVSKGLIFVLIGLFFYFFGNRLVYEIFMFFNSEIFFKSNMVLFNIKGSFDEYKQTVDGVARKDTFSEVTPDIKTASVLSSMYVHPYHNDFSKTRPSRFLLNIAANDELLDIITKQFQVNLSPYMMQNPNSSKNLDGNTENLID